MGEWKQLLWRPHIGQLLILFLIVSILFSSVVLLIVVPESRDLNARIRVLESMVFETLIKNQETVIAVAGRIEDDAKRLEQRAEEIHRSMQKVLEAHGVRGEEQHEELKGLMKEPEPKKEAPSEPHGKEAPLEPHGEDEPPKNE
jgi:hypothetical protein